MPQDAIDTVKDAPAALATPASEVNYQKVAADEFAERLGSRRREAGAPVRTIFVSDERVEKPPLARLMSGDTGAGGGRGGQVRAKLYVSLLWVCAKKPYTVIPNRPARAWAALLGLDDPEVKGVRRIQQAFRDLQERQLVDLEERVGFASVVTVLSERGDGTPFVPAPDAHNALKQAKANEATLLEHRYFRVPSTLWTDGHIAKLSGPAFAMLLALLSEQRGTTDGVWFSPGRARERFGLSTSTRRQGLDDLSRLGLVDTKTRVVSESGAYIDWARRRNVHHVTGL